MNAPAVDPFVVAHVALRSSRARRLRLLLRTAAWLAATTLLSRVPLPVPGAPAAVANLGACAAVLATLAWIRRDVASALLVGALTAAWASLPFAGWGPSGAVGGPIAALLLCWFGDWCVRAYFQTQATRPRPSDARAFWQGRAAQLALGAFGAWRSELLVRDAARDAAAWAALRAVTGTRWRNWAEIVESRPAVASVPRTVDDLVVLVRESAAAGRRLRAVGGGFSWSGFCASDETLVHCGALDRVEVDLSDPARPAVWAECGATNRAINDALRAHGLELPYNVVMETVRVGGITSMGTHGSGRHTATLGDLVEAFDVIDAAGRRRVLSEDTVGAEVMSAARLCFGLFGVIARVRLRAEPARPVLLRDQRVPLARALDRLEERLAVEESVELLWFPFSSGVWLHGYTRTDRPLPRRPGLAKSASDLAQMFVLNGVHGTAARLVPQAVPWLLRAYSLAMPYGERVARRSEAIHYRQWLEVIRCTCVEVGFKVGDDFSRVRAAFDVARAIIDEFAARGEYPIDININIRFTGPSKALLSAAWGPGLTCYIEALAMGRPKGWEACSAALLRAWLQLPGALPHWAKEFEHVPGVIPALRERLGERLTRFQNALRDSEIDPHGVFRNDLVQRLCLPEKDPR
jgi:FAD/FMN-containing dehydrogenase